MPIALILWAIFTVGSAPAYAQSPGSHTYKIYIDTDNDVRSGCAAALIDRHGSTTLTGAEFLVEIPSGEQSGPATIAACDNGSFGTASTVDASMRPVQISTDGTVTLHQVELTLPVSALGLSTSAPVVFALAAEGDYATANANGSMQLHVEVETDPETEPGTGTGTGTGTEQDAKPVPTLHAGVTFLLMLLVGYVGWKHRHRIHAPLVSTVLVAGALLAASGTFAWTSGALQSIVSQSVNWAGISPLVTDPVDDHVAGTPDLRAFYAAQQGNTLALRIDAATLDATTPEENITGNRDVSPMEKAGELPRFVSVPRLVANVDAAWMYQVRAVDHQKTACR